jgi:hypothetical protein
MNMDKDAQKLLISLAFVLALSAFNPSLAEKLLYALIGYLSSGAGPKDPLKMG